MEQYSSLTLALLKILIACRVAWLLLRTSSYWISPDFPFEDYPTTPHRSHNKAGNNNRPAIFGSAVLKNLSLRNDLPFFWFGNPIEWSLDILILRLCYFIYQSPFLFH